MKKEKQKELDKKVTPSEKTGYIISSFCNYFKISEKFPEVNNEIKRLKSIRHRFIHMNSNPMFIVGGSGTPIPEHPHYNGWENVDGPDMLEKMNYQYCQEQLILLEKMYSSILLQIKEEIDKDRLKLSGKEIKLSLWELPVRFEELCNIFSKRDFCVIGL